MGWQMISELGYYTTRNSKSPSKLITPPELLAMARMPRVAKGGAHPASLNKEQRNELKSQAGLITPFGGKGKTKQAASKANYHALVIDHDHDNLSPDELRAAYDAFSVYWFAFTTASNTEEDQRWKVIIPLAGTRDADTHNHASQGLAFYFGADEAQARTQQGFYEPLKLSSDAPYQCVEADDFLGFELAELSSTQSPLMLAVAEGWAKYEQQAQAKKQAQEQQREAIARAAKIKPSGLTEGAGIIGKIRNYYHYDIGGLIESRRYKMVGKRYLSPYSSSGAPGIIIFNDGTPGAKLYSHHGTSDPLSNLNHGGHALDYAGVLCELDYSGDYSAMVNHYAPIVDAGGQFQRQQEYAQKQSRKQTLETFTDDEVSQAYAKANSSANAPEFDLPPLPDELAKLGGGLGHIQKYIYGTMTYPCMSTAGWAAIATLTGFAQTKVTIDSRQGLGFNEYYLTLAKTGFGKEALRDPLNELIAAITFDFEDNTTSSRIKHTAKVESAAPSSRQGLHQLLENAPDHSVYIQSDEFAEWLKASKNDQHKQQALAYLLEIYSKATRIIHPGSAVTKDYKDVKKPRLSVFATTTPESVLRAMSIHDAEMGAYNRFVIYVAPEAMPTKRYTGLNFRPSAEAVEVVKHIAMLKETRITFTVCGFNEFVNQDQRLAEPVKFVDGLMGGRLSEQAVKLAGLFALSDRRQEINASDIKTAFSIRLGLYHRANALVVQSGAISGSHETTKAMDQIIGLLERHGTLYVSQLKNYSRAYKALHVSEQNTVLNTLLARGDAVHPKGQTKLLTLPKKMAS